MVSGFYKFTHFIVSQAGSLTDWLLLGWKYSPLSTRQETGERLFYETDAVLVVSLQSINHIWNLQPSRPRLGLHLCVASITDQYAKWSLLGLLGVQKRLGHTLISPVQGGVTPKFQRPSPLSCENSPGGGRWIRQRKEIGGYGYKLNKGLPVLDLLKTIQIKRLVLPILQMFLRF